MAVDNPSARRRRRRRQSRQFESHTTMHCLITIVVSLVVNIDRAIADCPLGCMCADENRDVRCDGVNLGSIPVFLTPRLRSLSLVDCNLNVYKDSISLYSNLEELDLSSNGLVTLPAAFFSELAALRVLRLANNQIGSLDARLFDGLGALEKLDLSNNPIVALDTQSLEPLNDLRVLNMSNGRLELLEPRVFASLANLTSLDLSSNRVRVLSAAAFSGLRALQNLDLSNNQIEHLHLEMLVDSRRLQHLDLTANRVAQIVAGTFKRLDESLLHLSLANNSLRDLTSAAFGELRSLQSLDLGGNTIVTLVGPQLEGLVALQTLRLDRSVELRELLTSVFEALPNLLTLSTRGSSRLQRVEGATTARRLRRVDLSDCAIETLASDSFRWPLLESARLTGNPWRCDCALLDFLSDASSRLKRRRSSRLVAVDSQTLRCAQPVTVQNMTLEMARSRLCTVETPSRQALMLIGVASGVAIIALALLFVGCAMSACCGRRRRDSKLRGRPTPTASFYGHVGGTTIGGSSSGVYEKSESTRDTLVDCGGGSSLSYAPYSSSAALNHHLLYQQPPPPPPPPPPFGTSTRTPIARPPSRSNYSSVFAAYGLQSSGVSACAHCSTSNGIYESTGEHQYAVAGERLPPAFCPPPPPTTLPPPPSRLYTPFYSS